MNKIKTTLKRLLDKSKGNLSIREHICIILIQKALNGSLDAFKLIKEILNNEITTNASNIEILGETIDKVMNKIKEL